ncbi:hypothetical protein ACN42_g9502 [Penicillium freii]|uniref:Uncharacterized protein n=1 Tax=Penicillium freii TaxID=48697 RepID=A0A101MBU8_PENFR|nr:hypothetical protein ACN42_g9502 [Penicillium freii]
MCVAWPERSTWWTSKCMVQCEILIELLKKLSYRVCEIQHGLLPKSTVGFHTLCNLTSSTTQSISHIAPCTLTSTK